jgi:hypothetical protein
MQLLLQQSAQNQERLHDLQKSLQKEQSLGQDAILAGSEVLQELARLKLQMWETFTAVLCCWILSASRNFCSEDEAHDKRAAAAKKTTGSKSSGKPMSSLPLFVRQARVLIPGVFVSDHNRFLSSRSGVIRSSSKRWHRLRCHRSDTTRRRKYFSKKLSGMSCKEVARVEQGEVLQLLQQQRNTEAWPWTKSRRFFYSGAIITWCVCAHVNMTFKNTRYSNASNLPHL